MQSALVMVCLIREVSLLCSALYAKCLCYVVMYINVVLYMQSVRVYVVLCMQSVLVMQCCVCKVPL